MTGITYQSCDVSDAGFQHSRATRADNVAEVLYLCDALRPPIDD